MRYKGTTLFRL